MTAIEFDYEERVAENVTVASLLDWIVDIHTELTNAGLLPGDTDGISDETHQQIFILALAAEERS